MAILLRQVISSDKEGLIGIVENGEKIPLSEPRPECLKFDSVLDGMRPWRDTRKNYLKLYEIMKESLNSRYDERFCIKISRIRLKQAEENTSAIVIYNIFGRR